MSKTLTDRSRADSPVDPEAGTLLVPRAPAPPAQPETVEAAAAQAPPAVAPPAPAADPAAGFAVRERGYECCFDGVLWDRCTRLDVERGCSSPVFRALRSGRITLVQNKRGMQFRRAPA